MFEKFKDAQKVRRQRKLNDAFLEAAFKFQFKKAKELLDEGAELTAVNEGGNNAFHRMAQQKKMYRGECSNGFGERYKFHPSSFFDFLRLLHGRGLDINAQNLVGDTPLHCLAAHSFKDQRDQDEQRQLIESLLKAGADPAVQNSRGKYPLHVLNNPLVVKILAEKTGYQVYDEERMNPLHFAVLRENAPVARKLAELCPALLDGTDERRNSPIAYAREGLRVELELSKKKYRALSESPAPSMPPVLPPKIETPVISSPYEWKKLGPTEIARVSKYEEVGYKITEIFDFAARRCREITHNLATKQDAIPVTKEFSEMMNQEILLEANRELVRQGGEDCGDVVGCYVLNRPSVTRPFFPQPNK